MRFGLPNLDYNFTDSQFYARELKSKPEKHLRAYTSLFMNHLCEPGDPNSSTFEDGVPKDGLNISHVLSRIGIISLIKRKVYEFESINGCISMKIIRRKVKPQSDEKPASEEPAAAENDEVKKETDESEKMEIDEQKTSTAESKEQIKTEDNNEEKNEKIEDKCDSVKNEDNEKDNGNDIVKTETKDEEEKDEIIKKEETGNNETKENNAEQEVKVEEEELEIIEEDIELLPVEFNIKDGGFTELHTIWYFEELELKPKHEHEIWNKRHDYWMLAGIVKHGYEQWARITSDPDFLILNEPFKSSPSIREKFMERRLRLLEQALVFEEQLRRTAHLSNQEVYVPKPKEESTDVENNDETKTNGETSDEKKNEEKPSENEEEKNKEAKTNDTWDKKDSEANSENKENEEEKILNPKLQRASNQLEELLNDMKSDCARIPQTVQRIPSIANRLQLGPRNIPNQMNINMQSSHSLLSSNRM